MITMPVDPNTFHPDLEHMRDILSKWCDKVGKEGVPGVDRALPDPELHYAAFIRELSGELLYVAGKAQNLALILTER